jgi:RNA recognition motif-containing protein
MENKLYVGNLSYGTTEDAIQDLFSQAGTVTSVNVIKDRETGRSKGFAFVEMSSQSEAEQAINQLNGASLDGRELKVSIARPREERPGGGGRGGYGNRGGNRGGGNRGGGYGNDRGGRDRRGGSSY